LLLLFCTLPLLQWAQDTLQINEIDVQTLKPQQSAIGKKTETLDSNQLSRYKTQDLGTLLAQEAGIHIKTYGPGALASTAFRGGSAAQTALVWNGINIQNRMLGQVDLSNLPAFIFDEVKVEYGGSSALWGSGAVGGSVLLGNSTRYLQGPSLALNAAYGSFERRTFSARYTQSNDKWVSSTRAWWHAAKNNYAYLNAVDSTLLTAKHAAYDMKGLMQEFRYRINNRQQLSFHAWLSDNTRQLPSFQNTRPAKTWQKDQSARLTALYECISGAQKSTLQAAYLFENLDYRDSAIASYSKSRVQSFILQSDNYLSLKKHNLNYGFYGSASLANSDNYVQMRQISSVTAVVGDRWQMMRDRFVLLAQVRQEIYFPGTSAFTWQVAGNFRLNKNFSARLSSAKVFRQPTFNEWYWQPGGNPLLKPEQGHTLEGNLQFDQTIRSFQLSINAAAFSRWIDNWILWVPGAGSNPTPLNIQSVWSRGSETSWRANYLHKKWQATLMFKSSYVLSTISKSQQVEDASVGRQLIYTPRYSGNASMICKYDRLQIEYYMQYIGYRFTSSDNLSWLQPYTTASVRLSYYFGHSKQLMGTLASHNIFNQNYVVVAGRPMPLRNYEIIISYQPKLRTKK
jgi:iron complex outermembrane receptor protein